MTTTPPSTPSFVHEPADYIAKKTVEYAQSEAFKYMEKLLTPQKNIVKVKSSLALLMARFNREKSYISALIDWYGQASWLDKATVGLAFLAIGTLIGAVMQLTTVFAILASALYLSLHFFIMDEFNIKTRREAQLVADIKAQEESLEQTATKLNEYIKELDSLSQKTHAQNLQFEQDIHAFKAQIKIFESQIATYKQTTIDLEAAKDALEKVNEAIKVDLNETRLSLQTTIDELNAQLTSLNVNIETLDTTNIDLVARHAELMLINQKLQASLSKMADFETRCDELLAALEVRNMDDAEISSLIPVSASDTIACIVNTNAFIKESDRVCDAISQQQLKSTSFFAQNGSEIDTDALLARVKTQIAANEAGSKETYSFRPGYQS